MLSRMVVLAAMLALLAGCAAKAHDELGKVEAGMNRDQVVEALGKPEKVMRVRFPGHERDYLIYEYTMVPDSVLCPSTFVGRGLAAIGTLGLSEVVVNHAEAAPHWVYFADGKLIYTSRAMDCAQNNCRTWPDPSDPYAQP